MKFTISLIVPTLLLNSSILAQTTIEEQNLKHTVPSFSSIQS